MKAGYLQFDVSHDKEENFRIITDFLQNFTGDLMVLPELSLCGYLFPDREALGRAAEAVPDGPSTRRMLELSQRCSCIIVFGLAEKENGRIYNTAAVAGYGQYCGKYRKVHLSDLEKNLFEEGNSNPVIDAGGFRLGVQICFDLWFPEISREQIQKGAQILCVPANFGGENTCKIAEVRAMENLTPLVLCNRIGTEYAPGLEACFRGESVIRDGAGKALFPAGPDREGMGCAELETGLRRSNVICRDFDAEIARHPLPDRV